MKITKTPKRLAEPVTEVVELLEKILNAPDDELPDLLGSTSEWCWPRGDLHYWIGVLNRFDSILEETCRDYDLHKLQINEFTPLRKRIVVGILKFTRLLVENCTSRRLYASYEHLNNLLFTRDVDVLEATLRLMLRFSQQTTNSSHPKAELLPSQDKLSILAVTWPPRDHDLDMVDIAREETIIPPGLLTVKFQYYRKREADDSFGTATQPPMNEDGPEGIASGTVNTPVRPRPRERLTSTNNGTVGGTAGGSSSLAAGFSGSQPQEGIETVELGRPCDLGGNAMDVMADVIEKTPGLSGDDHFELYQRIRLAMAMPDLYQRRQLLVCRLLAIACYAHIVPESTASTQLFLYEPELIPRLAALANPANKMLNSLVSSSLYALDALGRYRNKLHTVLSSLNASVNHGILLQILRNIIEDLSSGPQTECDEYVDAYIGLVSFITSTNIGSSMVVGSGLIQLLVKLVDEAKPDSYMIQRTLTRSVGLLDSVIYTYMPAFNIFCQARGLEIFVRRIEEEVDLDIETVTSKMDEGEGVDKDRLYGHLTFGRAHLLKSYMASISHMMVTTGTADGLRNLIDSSLLTSIKKIMEYRRIIGPQNLALAISIMATFVHNEPTSLAIIQEKKLPETFMTVIKDEIEAQFELINAIPNAIGALCLNQTGLDMFNAESIIDRLLSILTSEAHVKILQDQDNVTVFGAAIDELVRHQPTMKQALLDGIFKVFDSIHEAGRAFQTVELENASMYRLGKVEAESDTEVSTSGISSNEAVSTKDASNSTVQQGMALADVIVDEADVYSRKDDSMKDPNPITSYMDVMARFLEILFQSSNHCKDFLRADGLDKLLKFYTLPCLSYNFASTVTADSMVHLLRFIAEVNPNTVITALLREVKTSLLETKGLWNATEEVSTLFKLLKPNSEYELAQYNEKFHQLIKLNARMQLLADVTPTFTYSGSKSTTTLLQVLNTTPSIMAGNRDVATIADLGEFQKAWIWETILFKSATHSISKEAAKLQEDNAQSSPVKANAALDDALSAPLFQKKESSNQKAAPEEIATTKSPLVKNTIALRYITSQIKIALNSFFMETNRLLVSRRPHDSSHKRFASLTATQLGSILKQNMIWKSHSQISLSCDYLIVMIQQAAKLLYEERPGQAMHAQTITLVAFVKQGGLNELLSDYKRFSDEVEKNCDAEGTLVKNTNGLNDDILHACGGLQMALDLMLKMVNHTPLLEAPSTQTLKSKEGVSKDSSEYFEPRAFLINVRLTITPLLRQTWMKSWLINVNYSIARSVLRIILKLAEGQGEISTSSSTRSESGHGAIGAAGGPPSALMGLAQALGGPMGDLSRQRTMLVVDESRLRQLTDMGFPRRAARHALIRCSNNLNAATEYLLLHPEVVNSMQSGGDPQAPDGVPAAAPESTEAGNGATSEETTQETNNTEESAVDQTHNDAIVETTGQESTNGEALPQETESSSAAALAADTPMAESSEGGDEMEKPAEVPTKETSNIELPLLEKERSEILETLLKRSLELSDKFNDLVFVVRDAVRIATKSYSIVEPLKDLFKEIQDSAPQSFGTKMTFISVRLHLLALIFNDSAYAVKYASTGAKEFVQSLATLMDATSREKDGQIPTWMASFLLVISAILQAEDAFPEGKMIAKEDTSVHEMPRIWTGSLFEEELPKLLHFSLQKLSQASILARDDLLALYRFLVILTRRPAQATSFLEQDGFNLLMRPFSTLDLKDVAHCRTYAMLVMRHIIESNQGILEATMTQEVRSFFCQSRVKVMDTSSATKSLGPVILREPDLFLEVVKSNLELVDYKAAQGQGILKLPDANRSNSENVNSAEESQPVSLGNEGQPAFSTGFMAPLERGPDESMDLVPPSPTKQGASTDDQMLEVGDKVKDNSSASLLNNTLVSPTSLDIVMHFLLSELLRSIKERTIINSKKVEPVNNSTTEEAKTTMETSLVSASDSTYFYTCFLLQSLTELLSSYKACKISFLNFTKKRLFQGSTSTLAGRKDVQPKMRQSGTVLAFFLTELIPLGFVQSREHEEMRRLMSISNWAMSTIVALCADVVAITTDIKEIGSEVVFARKSVLDGIAKAIKEATIVGASGRVTEGVESRYGRLYSLSDLCFRLLKARPNVTSAGGNSSRSMDDLTLHMAKTMLERNFVTVLTSALAEVDLNMPMVKSLLDRILKPLEYLTKVAIKMHKAERKNDKRKADAEELNGDQFDSMDEDVADEESEESDEEEQQEAREETPDFYRNSSLGMHTGDLENSVGFDDDDDDGDDEEEDEDEEMEEGMEGVVYSDGDSDDSEGSSEDMEHIVEVLEAEGDEESDDDDDEDDDDDDEDDESEDEEEAGSWIDEDDEESEQLDFIIEGDAEEAHRLFQQAGHIFREGSEGEGDEDEEDGVEVAQVNYDVHEVEDEEDEEDEEEEMMDEEDESVLEGIFEHGDLSTMQAPSMHDHAPMDRFGATWTWTNNAAPPNVRGGTEDGGVPSSDVANTQTISPFAFLRQRPSRLSRSRRMNWEAAMDSMNANVPYASDGRMEALLNGRGEDVASHPLLVQSPSQSDLRGIPSNQLSRHLANRRGGRGAEGYQDWAQSLEGLMEGGAMQFLETLLQRNGMGQGGPGEAIHISLASGGMPRMTIGGTPSMRIRDARVHSTDRNGAMANDPVILVQEFNPIPTMARWSEDMRIIAGSQSEERLRLMRAHLVNTLRPAYLIAQEELRKKKEKLEEERKKAKEKEAAEKEKADKEKAEREIQEKANVGKVDEAKEEVAEASHEASINAVSSEIAIQSSSADGDVEMEDGNHDANNSAAPSSTPANLELNSLQQGLDELDTTASTGRVEAAPTAVQGIIDDDGSSTTTTTAIAAAAAPVVAPITPAAPRQRITTTINGNEIDITDSGIDPTFLEALPEEMREEVLNQHFRERRAAEAAAALAAGNSGSRSQPSNIAPEFLEALPPEIRAEVIQQEVAENARRRREERRGNGEGEEARGPSDIDPASFLASLNPDLRGAVLMEQDETFLNSIPESMRQEVETIRRQTQQLGESRRRLYHRNGGMPGIPVASNSRAAGPGGGETGQDQNKKGAPRDAIQLLDKAGVAALIRLLFFPLMDSNQSGLREVLVNLSENSKTRFELLNLLLMILAQCASEDANAVDKSFTTMSSQINRGFMQTPNRPTPKRTNTMSAVSSSAINGPPSAMNTPSAGTTSSNQVPLIAPVSRAGHEAPFLIASRSIETLIHLTTANEQAAHYFLKDDASNIGLMKWFKKNSNVKGKEREKVTSNAPINVLLVLLGKPSILANANLVDSLISLLNTVTRPLPLIVANRKRAEEEEEKEKNKQETQAKEETTVDEVDKEKIPTSGKSTIQTTAGDGEGEKQSSIQEMPVSAPQISEERMASVVKPLSISISSKGFQNTLAVASNLSSMDGARDVITSALQNEANAAGKNLMVELNDLLESLPAPSTTGKTEEEEEEEEKENQTKTKEAPPQQLSCPALTKLASPSSSQTVILRSLRALEWVMTRPKTASSVAALPPTAASGNHSSSNHHHHHHHHNRHHHRQTHGSFVNMF